VIGRAESDQSGLTGFFLAEDDCPRSAWSKGFAWPNKIALESDESFASDPNDKLQLDESVLSQKLTEIRRSTRLLFRPKTRFKAEGDRAWPDGVEQRKDVWEVAFGRIEIARDHQARRGVANRHAGFGDPPVAPAKLILRLNPRFIEN
jgi:hypothetical protein